jgi:hypothetical protein
VPKISEFYGIIVTMYREDHQPPHFHARYGEFKAVFGINPAQRLNGRLPARAEALVLEWARQHQAELAEN